MTPDKAAPKEAAKTAAAMQSLIRFACSLRRGFVTSSKISTAVLTSSKAQTKDTSMSKMIHSKEDTLKIKAKHKTTIAKKT